MYIEFLNNISLNIISGGNRYNQNIIEGLINKGHTVDYHVESKHNHYDLCILDSLVLNSIDYSKFHNNTPIFALIHQIPKIEAHKIEFLRDRAKCIVTGNPTKTELIDTWHLNPKNVTVIRPGIELTWNGKTTFKDIPKRILLVANFIENKGYEMLITLIETLEREEFEFRIVGNNDLNPSYAEHIIERLKQTNANVVILDKIDRNDLYLEFINADIFLSLSKSESFGMAIFEALTLNIPTISYKTGDYMFFETFKNYLPIENYNVKHFTSALLNWHSKPEDYSKFCNASNSTQRSWEMVTNEFHDFLTSNIVKV
ncbi:MAG: glycosyltransferase family 4 protein [Winogradskyella sp.]|uniref:glycosyltransferase family 4 protein n=1 Tax=Winogradskyella sp. TaxID=1883156 RepID=UPI0025D805A5|nr:glycosyltransferase family 4 protein [Winogradskyella sp.]NRB61314.1 glycosyltransferase family 4 protein [Winogradskyella sp.]